MKRETFRMIGAITGLLTGFAMMYLLGMDGLVPAAVFGAGGCVLGGIGGEQVYDRSGS